MTKKRTYGVVGLLVLLLTLAVALPAYAQDAGGPSDSGVQPEFVAGNPQCSHYGLIQVAYFSNPSGSGLTDGPVIVTTSNTALGSVFAWTSTLGIDVVIVKGGPNANVYTYDPPAESFGDSGLHPPINPENNKYYGISHISFCADFEPSVDVDKDGDPLSKVGDTVTYEFTITNDGDLPLELVSVNDTVLGDLTAEAIAAGCEFLDPGDWCYFEVPYVIPQGAPDPLPNIVTVTYSYVDPEGASGQVQDSDDHSVNLFQPAIELDKEGDELSKIGDTVDYVITLYNNSSADSPDLECTVTDPTVGVNEAFSVASGATHVIYVNDFEIPAGAADPFVNTAYASCSPIGFPNILEDEASWETNLFQPAIELSKTGDALSKIGDAVDYVITLNNNSSLDTPDLTCTVTDALLSVDETFSVASGGSHVINVNGFVIPPGAPDPFVNTASVTCSPDGFPNIYNDEASWSTNLFQPSVDVQKTGDELSKVGDPVNYVITVTNTSSADSPTLVNGTITDTLLGDLLDAANPYVTSSDCSASLVTGASCTILATRTVQAGDADPLPNTVTVHYNPFGFPNDISDWDDHSVNLFQPAIDVTKTGDPYSKAGDTVNYVITLYNNSSLDTPALNCTATDSLVGAVFGGVLPLGPTVVNVPYLVQAGDPDPLVNTVTLTCSPDGFPNVLTDSASHTVDLLHPSFTVSKSCDFEPVPAAGPANFTVTITNTGDVELIVTADDGIGTFNLAAGASQSFPVSIPGPFTPGGTVENTVTASWVLPAWTLLANTDTQSATDYCDVEQVVEFETAYALGTDPTCFIDLGAGNWGWVNGNGSTSILPGVYEWDLWAGAGQCDTGKGTLVGSVTVNYDGTNVSVAFNLLPGYILGATHVYAGYAQVPPGGFAPGGFQIYSPFDGSAIYVIAHAEVGIPQ